MSNNYEWKRLADLPVKLDMHTQATIGDDIYIFGGRTEGNITVDTLYKYNIPSDTWAQIPKSGTWPVKKYGHVMTSINGKLYVYGGYTGTAYDNSIWEFDPTNNMWTTKKSIAVYKYLASADVVNGEMVVIGGSSGSNSYQNTNYAYNPTTNTWRNYTPSFVLGRINPAVVAVSDILYIFGGATNNGSAYYGTLHTIENGILTRKDDHLPVRRYHTGAKYKDSMYSLFGYTNQAQTIEAPCEEYNTLTETWSIVPDSPSKRRLTAASSVSNGFIVTGGSVVSGEFLDEVWFYGEIEETPPEKEYTITWKKGADIPVTSLYYHASASVGNDVYVFGGRKNGNALVIVTNDLWKYSTEDDTWELLTTPSPKPSPRNGHMMVSINHLLYVIGGYDVNGQQSNETWEYNTLTNVWTQKQNFVNNSPNGSAVIRNGKIVVVISIANASMTVEEYDPSTDTWSTITSFGNSNTIPDNPFGLAIDNDNFIWICGGRKRSPIPAPTNTYVITPDNQLVDMGSHPPPRDFNAATFFNGKYYTYGGGQSNVYSADLSNSRFESFNRMTNEWENLSEDSPILRDIFGSALSNNKFVVSGGRFLQSGSPVYTNETWICEWVEKEEPKTYSWKRRPDIPVGGDANQLRYGAGATIGNDYYVFGGRIFNTDGSYSFTNRLWRYNTITKEWTEILQPSLKPSIRSNHSMVSLNGKLYVYGGSQGSGLSVNGEMWEYTPETNTWVQKTSGVNSVNHSMFVKGNRVYASGGNSQNSSNGTIDTLREYNPLTNSWIVVATNDTVKREFATSSYSTEHSIVYSGRVIEPEWVIFNTGYLFDNSIVDIAPNSSTGTQNSASGIIGDIFYVYGGGSKENNHDVFTSYNIVTKEWKPVDNYPPSRTGMAYSNIPNGFIVSGSASSTLGLEVWEYSLDGDDPIPPDPEPEEWGYTEYTTNTEVIVPENAESVYIVTVGAGAIGGGGLSHGKATVYPGETLWLEIDPVDTENGTTSVYAIRDGSKQLLMRALIASGVNGGKSWDGIPFSKLYGSYKGGDGIQYQTYSYFGGGAAGYYGDGNSGIGGSGKSGSSVSAGGNGNCDRNIKYRCQGGGGVGLAGEGLSGTSGGQGGSNGSNGSMGTVESYTCWNLGTKTDYRSTGGNGGNYGGGAGSGSYRGVPGNGGISLLWTNEKLLSENINNAIVDVSFDDETDELVDYENKLNDSSIVASDYQYPEVIENNTNIDISDYETPVGIYGNSGKITQVVKEKSRGRKVNHSTVDVSEQGDLQIRSNEAYLVASDEHEGFTNIYNKSIVTLSDKGELQIKSNYMWAEVSFNGIKYSKEFRLRETTPNTVTLSPIYDVEYDFIGIYPSDDTYDCEVFVNGVLQEKGEGKYFTLLLGDTIQFRITSPNPGEVKFVAINGDNILNIICPSKYGNYPDFLDFGEFTETFPNFWYETGELVIDGLYPLDSYSEIYVNNVRVWMVINDGEPTNRVNVTNGDRIKLVFKGSAPTELPEGETYKIYHDNDRGTYDVGQVVVKSIVVEGSETRQDIKFFIDMVILKTVTERQQLLLDSDYNHYQRTNHNSKNDFVLDSQHGIHDQDVSYIWDYTSIYENEVEYIWGITTILENIPNEYIWDSTKIWENTPNEYIWDKTSIYESDEQSYDVNEYPSYIFDEYDTDVINSIRFPIGTDFGKNVSDIKFEIDTSGFIDNNKAQYHINNEYDMHTQIIQYEIDNVYETVSGKDGNIHINAVEWIRNVEDISVLIDHVYEYYDLGIHNLVDSVYENNTTISKIYIDAEYVHFSYSQYYFEGSYTHILQAVHVPIDAVYDRNQTERWPTEAQEWEAVKVQYPAYADMVYYHLVKYNPYHIIDTEFQIYIHTESTDISGEYEEGTQHNNYKIDIVTDKGTSFVGYNFSGLYEKTEYNYHPVVTDKSLLVIGNSQTTVEGNDFEFVRDPVWQTDLIENLSGWHTREKAIEYAQSLNLSEEEIDLFEYEGRWGFTTDPELVVRDCSLPYPIIMIDKVIFWSH